MPYKIANVELNWIACNTPKCTVAMGPSKYCPAMLCTCLRMWNCSVTNANHLCQRQRSFTPLFRCCVVKLSVFHTTDFFCFGDCFNFRKGVTTASSSSRPQDGDGSASGWLAHSVSWQRGCWDLHRHLWRIQSEWGLSNAQVLWQMHKCSNAQNA